MYTSTRFEFERSSSQMRSAVSMSFCPFVVVLKNLPKKAGGGGDTGDCDVSGERGSDMAAIKAWSLDESVLTSLCF
jgi:hypothetical protein